MPLPAYRDGSIVNLTASVLTAFGGTSPYRPLELLPRDELVSARNVVLIVVDGLGHDYLLRQPAPTLRAHLRGKVTTVFPTTTAAAITSFFTGLAPAQHAITGWFMNLRELGTVVAILPLRSRSGASTLHLDGPAMRRLLAVPRALENLDHQTQVVTHRDLVESMYSAAVLGSVPQTGFDDQGGLFACIKDAVVSGGPGRRFVYAYWRELDSLSHKKGLASPGVTAVLADFDRGLSELLAELAGTDTLVVVTADHGIVDTRPERILHLEDHPELASTLSVPLCGEPRAAYCYVHPNRAADFERYVAGKLEAVCSLHRSEDLVAQGWLGLGTPDPRLADRIGDYLLLMEDDWVIKDRLLGEEPFGQIGVHGGVSEAEMYVPLIVARV